MDCKSDDEVEAFVKNLSFQVQYNNQEFEDWVYDDNGGVKKVRHASSYPILWEN